MASTLDALILAGMVAVFSSCSDNTQPQRVDGAPKDGLKDGRLGDVRRPPDKKQGEYVPSVPCGTITRTGCCEGDLLKYCEGGGLHTLQCKTQTCGWAGTFYDCGTGGAADPSGKNPKPCSGNVDLGAKTDTPGKAG